MLKSIKASFLILYDKLWSIFTELHEKVMDNKAENLTLMRESEELNKYIDKLMKKSSTFEPLAK